MKAVMLKKNNQEITCICIKKD